MLMSVTEGPAGVLLNLMDRHPMRPAHIHLMVSRPSYLSRPSLPLKYLPKLTILASF